MRIHLTKPAADYLDAFPLGNGRLGATVGGQLPRERIALNHENLWRGLNRHHDETLKVPPEQLQEVRDALLAGDYAKGHELFTRYLSGPRENPDGLARIQPYQPLGDLWLDFYHEGGDYSRELRLNEARAVVRHTHDGVEFTRETFVSEPRQAVVVRVKASRPDALNLGVWLSRIGDPQCQLRRWAKEKSCGLLGSFAEGVAFAAEARVLAHDGTLAVDQRGRRLELSGATELLLAVSMAVDLDWPYPFSQPDPAAACAKTLDTLAPNYETLLAEHLAEYQPLFNRFKLRLDGPAELEALPTDERRRRLAAGASDPGLFALHHDFGRYLLLSCSRKCDQPANLQGVWNEELRPAWQCYFSTDINLEMCYWPAESWNLPECVEPLFASLERHLPGARRAAQDYYGCRGFQLFTGDIWQMCYLCCADYDAWTGTSAMLAAHYWFRHERSADDTFLREKAYPFLREVARFYADFLVPGPDGRLVACPTQSPENAFADGREHPAGPSYCYGATMDTTLAMEVFERSVQAAATLGVDPEERDVWKQKLAELAPLRIGKDGRLLEWAREVEELEPGHRHLSHLYGVFPGDALRPDRNAEAFAAAWKSLEFRLQHGAGQQGWSRAWVCCLLARFGKAELAHESLRRLLVDSTSDSLLDVYPLPESSAAARQPALSRAHPPEVFQMEGNLGGAAAVLELLFQSHGGTVRLLPALPAAWPDGELSGAKLAGAFTLAMRWDGGKLRHAHIEAAAESVCRLLPPEGKYLLTSGDRQRRIQGGAVAEIPCRPGTELHLERIHD